MKIKMLSFLVTVIFMGSLFSSFTYGNRFNYDHCFGEADQVEQNLLDQGNSAEFAYAASNGYLDDCINDVDIAAAEYFAAN